MQCACVNQYAKNCQVLCGTLKDCGGVLMACVPGVGAMFRYFASAMCYCHVDFATHLFWMLILAVDDECINAYCVQTIRNGKVHFRD